MRSILSAVKSNFQRCLKAEMASQAAPPGMLRSRISETYLLKTSPTDFIWLNLSGWYPDFVIMSTSSTEDWSRTCFTTASEVRPHLASRACTFCALTGSPSLRFLPGCVSSSSSRLSMRLRRKEPSTASLKCSSTSMPACKSSSSSSSSAAASPTSASVASRSSPSARPSIPPISASSFASSASSTPSRPSKPSSASISAIAGARDNVRAHVE
mmetsp:Transcript_66395/g.216035  ORF Transcript_66395/g.216035 Transcript_66395/m.216035 type:complete len:213 (+) Transcript_66395:713-1351(+)